MTLHRPSLEADLRREADMRAVRLPPEHPPVKTGKVGVLLLNLGTPDGTDYWSMRRYLKQFLSDRRVIEVPRLLWWPLLNLIILTVRPGKKGKDYASIWNKRRTRGRSRPSRGTRPRSSLRALRGTTR